MRRWIFVLGLLTAWSTNAAAAAVDLNAAQSARYHALTEQLRCLVCQNQSIATSDAPLAADLRQIVAKQITAGRSDAQIKRYLVDRYGQWVLYDPPFEFATWLLWLGPFVLLLLGLATVVMMTRRRRQDTPARAPAVDRARLAAMLAERSSPDAGDHDARERR